MKIAMIGSGGIAERHLGTLATLPDVDVVGHVARTRASAERAAARHGGRAHPDVAALLAAEAPDAVWITVPPDAHGAIEDVVIGAGVPFLVEKPLAADRATAVAIGDRIARSGLVTAVGYQWRALDALDEVRRAIANHPVRMVLGAWHGALPEPAWWRSDSRGGGQMVEQATHVVDLARHLLGEAEVLHAATVDPERPDTDVAAAVGATLRFDAGPLGMFTASNVAGSSVDVSLRLVCDGLQITITRDGTTFEDPRERRLSHRRVDPIREQNRAFLRAIREGDASIPYSRYADALLTHHLTFDVVDAARPA